MAPTCVDTPFRAVPQLEPPWHGRLKHNSPLGFNGGSRLGLFTVVFPNRRLEFCLNGTSWNNTRLFVFQLSV